MMQPKIEFVTTFSNDGYLCYGQQFIDSFVEHSDFPLTIYHESMPNVDFHKLLTWRNLDHDEERKLFIAHAKGRGLVGDASMPNTQSVRFCHKVFALTDAAQRSEADWLIWIDADVFINGKIDAERMDRVLQDAWLVYLGRPRYHYTECGFVGYRIEKPPVQLMLEDMRRYYTSREIWTHPQDWWHDSKCFDVCRERSAVPQHHWLSLSDQSPDPCHVWPHTILAEFSTHQKGPRRKHDAYGSIVD